VFERFHQVGGSITRQFGGIGLGLTLSWEIIIAHGGRIWAESTGVPGEGSKFVVELPVGDDG